LSAVPTSDLRRALLGDGSLALGADAAFAADLERWMPRLLSPAPPAPTRSSTVALIDLRECPARPAPRPAADPTFRLGSVGAWVDDAAEIATLRGADARNAGEVDLARRLARLHAVPTERAGEGAGMDVFTMLTISAALLLGRMERTLMHSAAVLDAEGGAWLLVGDTHSGKTTTTVNLVRGGARYLSDDHVVLCAGPEAGSVWVEGWPRIFHVDAGWERGDVLGHRVGLDPASFAPDRWVRRAPLAGLLFPEVLPDHPTRLEPLPAATALVRILRQSPWLFGDRGAAPALLALLQRAAEMPAFRLRLGRDSYRDVDRLRSSLHPLFPTRGGTSRPRLAGRTARDAAADTAGA
jgi:hypothetical protein